MRRVGRLPLLVVSACWLAAGPGGVTLRAIAACWHHPTPAPHGAHHPLPAPGEPCFCGEMTHGGDLALITPALAAPAVSAASVAAPLLQVTFPPPPSLFPGFTAAPAPPPPDVLA